MRTQSGLDQYGSGPYSSMGGCVDGGRNWDVEMANIYVASMANGFPKPAVVAAGEVTDLGSLTSTEWEEQE